MGLALFCKHEKYDVLSWRYQNIGKYNQHILAKIRCQKCEKIIEKIIEEQQDAFALVYEDKFGR